MPAKRIPCPYTPARLHEMYWREGMSIMEIAHSCGHSDTLILRWLKDASITIKTLREGQLHSHARKPDRPPPMRPDGPSPQGAFMAGDVVQRKGTLVSAKMRKAKSTPLLTRPCCWWSCSNTVSRDYPSGFRHTVWFCGNSCSKKYYFATEATQIDCQDIASHWLATKGR